MSKFKVGEKVIPSDTKAWNDGSKYKSIVRIENRGYYKSYFIKEQELPWYDEELELYKEEEEMKELTFKEIIVNIKEGQTWDDGRYIKIEKVCGEIKIGSIDDKPYKELIAFVINDCRKFKLQRKEYTFEEAFKAYEEGKEIESAVSSISYQKKHDEEIFIIAKEIRGKWYIND